MNGANVSGGSGFNQFIATQFEVNSAEKLQFAIDAGQDKEELRNAALGAIRMLEKELQAHSTESLKGKYLELVDKFAKLFPEEVKDLNHINEFAQNVLGIQKPIAGKMEKLQEMREATPSTTNKNEIIKNSAIKVDNLSKNRFGKIDQVPSKVTASIKSANLDIADIPVPPPEPKFDYSALKKKTVIANQEALSLNEPPLTKNEQITFTNENILKNFETENKIDDLPLKNVEIAESLLKEVKKEEVIVAPPKPSVEAKAKTVNFPLMIEDVKVLSVSLGSVTETKLVEADGQKFVKKTGISGKLTSAGGDQAAHITSEYHTNKVYQALGVPVPSPMIYHTTTTASIKGDLPPGVHPMDVTSTTMLSEFIESNSWDDYMNDASIPNEQKERTKELLRQHFVVDCLLGNYSVMGYDSDSIRVTQEGVPYRIDNSSGLDHTAEGKPKNRDLWGETVTEIDSLRDTGHVKTEVRNAAEIYKDVTDEMIRDQVADLVSKKDLILDSLPKRYHEVIEQRLQYLQTRFPPVSPLDNLPTLTTQETYEQLKDQPIGSVIARKSSDPATPDQLVIAYKNSEGYPPNYGVHQHKLPPGSGGKFIYNKKEYTIDELVNLIKEKYVPPEKLVADCLKAGAPKNADDAEALKKNLKAAFKGKVGFGWYEESAVKFVIDKIETLSAIYKGNLEGLSPLELHEIEDGLASFFEFPIPKEIKEGTRELREKLEKQYASETFDPKPVLEEALLKGTITFDDINAMTMVGADEDKFFEAAKEIALERLLDKSKSDDEIRSTLKRLDDLLNLAGAGDISDFLLQYRSEIVALTEGSKTVDEKSLEEMMNFYYRYKEAPLATVLLDNAVVGYKLHLVEAAADFEEVLRSTDISKNQETNEYKAGINNAIQRYRNLQRLSELSKEPIPEGANQVFSEKVLLQIYKASASQALLKVLEGKISELSLEDLGKIPTEVDSITDLPAPRQASIPSVANAVLNWVDTHKDEIRKNPALATRAHHLLHDLAQKEIAAGNVKNGFEIEARAATTIPLSETHPLHNMEEAILQGTAKQHDARTGAFFSSLDTSIVKGGNLHAAQRQIDGELVNTFDFKISHYARDELTVHVEAILKNPKEFVASVPNELARSVKINHNVSQEFLRYDSDKNQFTRNGAYSPGGSTATEIVFEGIGRIIIGDNKKNGTMYNRIQVEMAADLPPGEGAKKLQQMLTVAGLGPVLGEQPPEADERMKIAQLFRAYYPRSATSLDTTKEFYELPIEDLKKRIIALEPGMDAVFKKYFDTHPDLMQKVEILPGKEIWGVKDLGAQMKSEGAWGLMTGVGNSGGWDSAKSAIARTLTQGAMSSEQRFETGVFKAGASSEDDLLSGGGDQVFTRMINENTGYDGVWEFPFHGNAQILWDLDSVAQRVPYGYDHDKYGVKNRFKAFSSKGTYSDYQKRPSMLEMARSSTSSDNEVMVKNSLDPSHVVGVLVESKKRKTELIDHLVSEGLAEKDTVDSLYYVKFAGKRIKADDFIHVGYQFEQEMWG